MTGWPPNISPKAHPNTLMARQAAVRAGASSTNNKIFAHSASGRFVRIHRQLTMPATTLLVKPMGTAAAPAPAQDARVEITSGPSKTNKTIQSDCLRAGGKIR